MKQFRFIIFLLASLFFIACQSVSPDKFFGQVVLNTNLIADFDPTTFGKRLQQETVEFPDIPSSKKNGDEAQQIVAMKIMSVEKAIKDIKDLNVSDEDAKVLQQQSVKLFETVLPVYKNEYTAYAKLCDTKGSDQEKQSLLQKVEKDHLTGVDELFESVYSLGKAYAEKHQLNVSWGN